MYEAFNHVFIDRTRFFDVEKVFFSRWNDVDQSGMLVSEVEMPTGFFPDEHTLESQDKIKRFEHKGKVVNLYFDGVSI